MIILFDVDKSTSVIADKVDKNHFQIRPLKSDFEGTEFQEGENQPVKTSGMDHNFYHYLNLLFVHKILKYKDKIFGYEDEMIVKRLNDRAIEMGLHTMVLDSISGMGESLRLTMIEESRFNNMSKDLWGKYAVKVGKLVNTIRDLPINFIVTCHIDYKEDNVGVDQHFAAIKGGQKTDMLRWFDIIVYTYVDDQGDLWWQVQRDENRPSIRSRVPIKAWEGQKYVSQNFGPIYKTYTTPFKMLLIGDSGTGKTSSLVTIPYDPQTTK